ncbi:hypothetical protein [Ectothiorhodospira lacustris]|uniref:hypothetical protein n=1 Tax=Ectothiorhodospira lacustris TaxID=2899127 RepID=UPI001EE7B0BE|nr:hypothetical protein [Ectothiorhodospira lacustris]MCG5508753.1 hypothetical protein [Ectothiorhodospira lacustris]MCG5520544.1 hypothetical protein [Ectothiorhodospira lacustris]
MARRLKLAGLIDLLWVEQPREILELAQDRRLDREFLPQGPWLNRLLARGIRRHLQLDGQPLPPLAPIGDERPNAAQITLAQSLEGPPCSQADLEALAAYVARGNTLDGPGVLVQGIVGRLFNGDYRADPQSYRDACLLDTAARTLNPWRQWRWRRSGDVDQARARLAEKVDRDPVALHATAIAVHNLVAALERMRRLAMERPRTLAHITPAAAASRCLAAPGTVLRQARTHGNHAVGSFAPGTLILFRLETARARSLRHDVAFLTHTWSRCPAAAWAPRLLSEAWRKAGKMMPAQGG